MYQKIIHEKMMEKPIRDWLKQFQLSNKNVYLLEHDKKIKVNQKVVNNRYLLKKGDVITIDFSNIVAQKPAPFRGDIDVIYEDDELLVVNKPAGLLVHSDGISKDSLTNRIAFHYQDFAYPILPVHRLDLATEGLMVFAKNPLALAYMQHQFSERQVDKVYEAWVWGKMLKTKGTIRLPIGKDRHSSKQRVVKTGKPAQTMYEVMQTTANQTQLKIQIKEGRTHQIRVHLAHIGHPIVGDLLYGNKQGEKLALIFKEMTFSHPWTKKPLTITQGE